MKGSSKDSADVNNDELATATTVGDRRREGDRRKERDRRTEKRRHRGISDRRHAMSIEKITKFIVKTGGCNPEDVEPEAELEALGIDSLKAITLLFDIEEAYDIEIPNEIIPSIITVKDIQDKLADLSQ
ncbi:MAG: phosphopantetheine-binding protein [Thermodesulfobacteriota bacterium]|nr:phosphopantetheine-binding protein [Thermodesulfobacteriota bacterium]